MTLSSTRPLVLASGSPRRRELLASLGLPLVVLPADVDETERAGEPVDVYLERVVAAKLARATELAPRAPQPSSSPTPSSRFEGRILGKPRDDEDAAATVGRIAGRSHDVMTRFAVRAGERVVARTVRTRVTVRALEPAAIAAYASSGEGRDKAGAYAIQGRFGLAVRGIEGSYSNVVGLPVAEVVEALEELGLVDAATLLSGGTPLAEGAAPGGSGRD